MGLRTLLVEDERLTRKDLRDMLAGMPEVVVVGEAGTLSEAVQMIKEHDPELVFLDIRLGRESGFDLLSRVEARFDVVFVTAFDEFAVKAFEMGAVHYLLKPVELEPLQEALRRIELKQLPKVTAESRFVEGDRLFVHSGTEWRFLEVNTIKWIEAVGDYSRLHLTEGRPMLLHRPMREWEARLPKRIFRRVHRSVIVNLDHVQRVEEWSASTFHLYLKGLAEPVRMSRRYAARLKQ